MTSPPGGPHPTGENPNGVGASPLRKEDARHLAGRGLFVSDIPADNIWEAAILRSPVAHGYLKGIDTGNLPDGCRVLSAADFPDIGPIRAVPRVPGFKASDFRSLRPTRFVMSASR